MRFAGPKSDSPGPEGAAGCSHGCSGGAAQPAAAQPVETRLVFSFRPGGAKEARYGHLLLCPFGAGSRPDVDVHGLRLVRLSADCAPPVATVRRPVGAKTANAESFGDERFIVLESLIESL